VSQKLNNDRRSIGKVIGAREKRERKTPLSLSLERPFDRAEQEPLVETSGQALRVV
jgi:hypothetical protein